MDFDHRGQVALDSDAVRTHHQRDALALGVLDRCPKRLGVLSALFEDVSDLDATEHLERLGADRARLTGGDGAKIEPLVDADVAVDVDAAQVVIVAVSAGGHVGAAA